MDVVRGLGSRGIPKPLARQSQPNDTPPRITKQRTKMDQPAPYCGLTMARVLETGEIQSLNELQVREEEAVDSMIHLGMEKSTAYVGEKPKDN